MSRNRRTSLDEARRRGLSRVAPITAGIVLAGGVMSVSTAVALAATRDTPSPATIVPAGSGSSTAPAVTTPQQPDSRPVRHRPVQERVAPPNPPADGSQPGQQGGGGVASGGNNPPQGQSQGS